MRQGKGTTRNGGESELEFLRGKNRELVKEIKRLKKQVEYLERQLNNLQGVKNVLYQNQTNNAKNKQVNVSIKNKVDKLCPECQRGNVQEFIIKAPTKILVFDTCQICGFRKKVEERK